ncbi:MAG: TIGR03087 family PEP-CTERM/XrtA system glycosyltransferase [Candidatus Polarisedimenticolaceae bacterium]|nr:TIGR03087 family PEP-CTERM/XrtA system glycosyltransferase [Candidatus Polarisedimenticolaceae bacterium]
MEATDKKPALLFLVHRIPFPPNKGDKIRSYHLLKFLLKQYRVFLGAFIDDKADWKHVSQLQDWCEESCFIELNPAQAKIKSLQGLFLKQPLTLPYYASDQLQTWVDQTIQQHNIQRTLVFSSAMAQYLLAPKYGKICRVIDFVDVDSDKWQQYSERKPWPLSWVYKREAQELLCFEREVAMQFDASLFVSSAEAQFFKERVPDCAERVDHFNNGVDTEYFSPDENFPTPYNESEKVLVFSGAMDYWPNVDAVIWFARDVLPKIRAQHPDVRFFIVGSNPTDAVQQLAAYPGVVVTGFVLDIRPYLQHATFAVVPMRVARGIQNKVLEAMAMAKSVLVTPSGIEGIDAEPDKDVVMADNSESLVRQSLLLLRQNGSAMGAKAREFVCKNFNWNENLPKVGELLEQGSTKKI